MKIHIFYNFQDGPWGGGNQFLKALRDQFRYKNIYADSLQDADVILINSHHFGGVGYLSDLLNILQDDPRKTIIHRIDGPVGQIRGDDQETDAVIFNFNLIFATGSIIQSKWCRENCLRFGLDLTNKVHEIIYNAPDPRAFYPSTNRVNAKSAKTRLIATSWSSNMRKGFEVYQWMDQNLDWSRYDMTFVGQSPLAFKNITHLDPMDSNALGQCLREHDIFVTASQNDPCSNSLIEALHTGLPALVLNDGGHPELVGDGGLTFDSVDDIPAKLSMLSSHLAAYRQKIDMSPIDAIADHYLEFMRQCHGLQRGRITEEDAEKFCAEYQRYLKNNQSPRIHKRVLKKLLKTFQ